MAKFGHSELQIEQKSLKFAPKLPRNCSQIAPKSHPNRSKSLESLEMGQNGSKSLETAQMATKSAQKETLQVVTAAEFLKSGVRWCVYPSVQVREGTTSWTSLTVEQRQSHRSRASRSCNHHGRVAVATRGRMGIYSKMQFRLTWPDTV